MGALFLEDLAEITRNAITQANICNKMPLSGPAPANLTPISQTTTQLTKMVTGEPNDFYILKTETDRSSASGNF